MGIFIIAFEVSSSYWPYYYAVPSSRIGREIGPIPNTTYFVRYILQRLNFKMPFK